MLRKATETIAGIATVVAFYHGAIPSVATGIHYTSLLGGWSQFVSGLSVETGWSLAMVNAVAVGLYLWKR